MSLTVDISHILRWEGRLTGIERTEFNLIKYYFDHQANFVYWDDMSSIWLAADKEYVRGHILNRETAIATRDDKRYTGVLTKASQRLRAKLSKPAQNNPNKAHIGDVFLIPAGLWDNKAYISSLENLAATTKLTHIVYDMIPLVQPGFVVDYLPKVFGNYMLRILPACDKVFAISKNSKDDITMVLKKSGLKVPKVEVFRLGDDIDTAGNDKRPDGVPDDYILTVGTIESRKNHQIFSYVYELAKEKNINLPPLVVAGKKGWHTENLLHLFEMDPYLSKRIIVLDGTGDIYLRWLYKNASLTVFPSVYEGWGLPVAESLAYGRVTLSSHSSSMPEVGELAADYFSPYSPDELLDLLVKYSKQDLVAKRENEIKSQFKLVTWEQALTLFDKQLTAQ